MQYEMSELIEKRWEDACNKLPHLRSATFTWEYAEHAHFEKPRGYCILRSYGPTTVHLLVARKIDDADGDRQDALIRHEVGHAIDLVSNAASLNAWAAYFNVELPATLERRADALAALVWGAPVRYDAEDVQALSTGVTPRPERLGL